MSTGTAPLEAPTMPPRIGSFLVAGDDPVSPEGDGSSVRVIGADESGFAGRKAVARMAPVPTTPDERAVLEVSLAKLRHLTHGAFSPILEAGIEEQSAFWVFAEPVGKTIGDQLAGGSWSISRVHELVKWLGGALQIAHEVGLSHGAINAVSVYLQGDGTPELFGLGPNGNGPAQDQLDLAMLAIQLLAGKPWNEREPTLEPDADSHAWRAQQLREFLPDCTARIAACLARATESDPSARFATMAEFVSGFDEAMRMSADDLVHGAYEAISARSPELARLLADRAASYDPSCEGLILLNLQLRGESPFGASGTAPVLTPIPSQEGEDQPVSQLLLPPAALDSTLRTPSFLLPPELTKGLPQEFLDSIAPQFEVTPVKKGMNPMFVLCFGGVGIVVLLALAGLATLVLSGN